MVDWPLSLDELLPFYAQAEAALGVAGAPDGGGSPPAGLRCPARARCRPTR